MIDLRCLNIEELERLAVSLDEKSFRGKQIFEWINKNYAKDFSAMTNLSKAFLAKLAENAYISPVREIKTLISSDGGSTKYLLELEKGDIIETVKMDTPYGASVCVSTQAGCNMGCKFCASAIGGKSRDLTAGEIAGQVYMCCSESEKRISNVVFMGCGEPLDNYAQTVKAVRLLTDPNGANISARKITVSTCGILNGIDKLAGENMPITLAVSLHAPNGEIRKTLMPIARTQSFEDLMATCANYANVTKRRVTFEYALIDGVNDSADNAEELADNLRGIMCHVNLIPVNAVAESGFAPPKKGAVSVFEEVLTKRNIAVSIRRERGADINAACGQLRKNHASN
ncbi:putative dual-specificity RNA methyltransferase RlmN [Clostridia bacterium]|nr:putative dual-specificity RNA methyltransferase RlmN [Clostridia bacterium]